MSKPFDPLESNVSETSSAKDPLTFSLTHPWLDQEPSPSTDDSKPDQPPASDTNTDAS